VAEEEAPTVIARSLLVKARSSLGG
jgi:hypothetical protein